MHLYWRMIEELKYLGERWDIVDPAILRRYELWKQRHCEALETIQTGTKSAEPGAPLMLCNCSNAIH
jgi:hypothetical protein